MKNESNISLIVNITYSLFEMNRRLDYQPPLFNVTMYILNEMELVLETKNKERKEYLKANEEDILSEKFKAKKKVLDDLIKSLKNEILLLFRNYEGELYRTVTLEKNIKKNLDEIFGNLSLIKNQEEEGSLILCLMSDQYIKRILKLFEKLGKAIIKREVFDEVQRDVLLDGVYKRIFEFESVPKACEYYKNNIEELFDRKKLKKWIKESVVINEGGMIIDERSTINNRVNSWINHENEKYTKN